MSSHDRPRVDVGVVTWNTAELSAGSLRRLMDSDQGVDIRLLVRDNASSDGTADAIAARVPEAEIDTGTENLGFSGGVNTLLARSDAPWFFLLNSDAWPMPNAIATLVDIARTKERIGAVVPRMEYPDGRLQHSTHPFPSLRVAAIANFAWNRIAIQRAEELMFEGAWMHDRPRTVDWAHGAAMLIPRSTIDAIGGFDESFFFYAEDLEWCWRAHEHGLQIWFEPSAVVQHVQSASGDQLYAGARTKAHLSNALRFYRRAHGTPAAAAWWGLNTTGAALRAIAGTARRNDAASYWRSYFKAQLFAPFAKERRPDR